MDFSLACTYIIIIGYLGITIYLANLAIMGDDSALGQRVQRLLYGAPLLMGLMAMYTLLFAFTSQQMATLPESERERFGDLALPEVSALTLLSALGVCLLTALAMVAIINSGELRQAFRRFLGTLYNPASPIHTTALVFALLILVGNTVPFLLEGGVSNVAENIETDGYSVSMTLLQAVIEVAVAFLGIGYALRRDWSSAQLRLGLRLPTQRDLLWAVGALLFIFVLLSVYDAVLFQFFTEEQISEQTQAGEALANQFSTLPLALLLAATSSIGEEIFFRGALQPVFGLLPTTLFFTLLHTQVLVTPGIVVIFLVGLSFGWLRQRQSTTSAIIAHFAYNFILLLPTILNGGGGSS